MPQLPCIQKGVGKPFPGLKFFYIFSSFKKPIASSKSSYLSLSFSIRFWIPIIIWEPPPPQVRPPSPTLCWAECSSQWSLTLNTCTFPLYIHTHQQFILVIVSLYTVNDMSQEFKERNQPEFGLAMRHMLQITVKAGSSEKINFVSRMR